MESNLWTYAAVALAVVVAIFLLMHRRAAARERARAKFLAQLQEDERKTRYARQEALQYDRGGNRSRGTTSTAQRHKKQPPRKVADESSRSSDDGFITSMAIGAATNDPVMAGLIGGNFVGGLVGAGMVQDEEDRPSASSRSSDTPSYTPSDTGPSYGDSGGGDSGGDD